MYILQPDVSTCGDLSFTDQDLPYEVLMGALNVNTIRALEDVLIDTIYSVIVKRIENDNGSLIETALEGASARQIRSEDKEYASHLCNCT